MVWSSPERHGAMSGIMKAQIDWIPLTLGAVRPTQGKTLAVMQVSGGSQSFNAVNQMRVLGRWMRMITIPNQSSVAKAFQEFDEAGRMKPSAYYERVVDVMEELVKFTLLTRDVAPLSRRSLQRAQGERRGAVAACQPARHLKQLRKWGDCPAASPTIGHQIHCSAMDGSKRRTLVLLLPALVDSISAGRERPSVAGSVSTRPGQQAVFRCVGLAGEGQLPGAATGGPGHRPLPVAGDR